MIGKLLGRMFGASGDGSGGSTLASEHYAGFDIEAAPVQEANGWRVSGTISRTIDGERHTHQFVRADTCGDADSAASMTLRKARQLIDERGEAIFH